MRVLKVLAVTVGVFGLAASRPAASLAHEMHSKQDIPILKDSAAALKPVNPELAKKLAKFSESESQEKR